MVKVIGIDPGKTTGICIMIPRGEDLEPIAAFEVKDENFCDWLTNELHTWEPTHVVYEDYIQEVPLNARPDEQFPQPTAKMCGAIILRCAQLKIPCIRQSRTAKPDGYRFLGKTFKLGEKKESVHMDDAASHAAYLIRKGSTNGNEGYRFFVYGQGSKGRQRSRRTSR